MQTQTQTQSEKLKLKVIKRNLINNIANTTKASMYYTGTHEFAPFLASIPLYHQFKPHKRNNNDIVGALGSKKIPIKNNLSKVIFPSIIFSTYLFDR